MQYEEEPIWSLGQTTPVAYIRRVIIENHLDDGIPATWELVDIYNP